MVRKYLIGLENGYLNVSGQNMKNNKQEDEIFAHKKNNKKCGKLRGNKHGIKFPICVLHNLR